MQATATFALWAIHDRKLPLTPKRSAAIPRYQTYDI
jgi:hypothetical protein